MLSTVEYRMVYTTNHVQATLIILWFHPDCTLIRPCFLNLCNLVVYKRILHNTFWTVIVCYNCSEEKCFKVGVNSCTVSTCESILFPPPSSVMLYIDKYISPLHFLLLGAYLVVYTKGAERRGLFATWTPSPMDGLFVVNRLRRITLNKTQIISK